MILRSIKPISATKQLTPLDTDHVSLHPYQPFRPAINHEKYIYTTQPNAVSNSSTTTRSLTLTLPTPGLASLWLYASPHSFNETNQQQQPAHASHYSFPFYRLINDKMRTSLTFLTLLAAAGSAVAAPIPASNMGNGAVQKIVSGHHRRSDSQVMVDLKEHMVSQFLRLIQDFTKI
jgi:hypothetical protein